MKQNNKTININRKLRKLFFFILLTLFLSISFFCKNDYCIQYELIQAPVELSLSTQDTGNTLRFYSANIEGDFKGYTIFIATDKSDLVDSVDSGDSCEGIDIYKPASKGIECICNATCRSDISKNPTSKRKIIIGTESDSATCNMEIPDSWLSGSFVALKAYVEDAAGDKRYSRYSNFVEIK